jgi:drug/metabolite transporter (DMT)-like permease
MSSEGRKKGITAALSSAFLLGIVPIFGKVAMNSGFSPFAVIALRSSIAALLMLGLMYFRMKPFFYIYPVGLIGCVLAGFINGLGSVLYYTALDRLEASIGHMLYSSYPIFVALWLLMDRQPITRLTIFRLFLAIPASILLVYSGNHSIDGLGALMMIGSAILYALHLIINQRILYEAPAPTVTLYTLLSMAVTVDMAFLVVHPALPTTVIFYWPVIAMAIITFVSRLTLFMGIKHLGGLQTAMLGLAELLITVLFANLFLGETLTLLQWCGAGLLMLSLIMVGFDKMTTQKRSTSGMLSWLNPPKIDSTDIPWSSHS